MTIQRMLTCHNPIIPAIIMFTMNACLQNMGVPVSDPPENTVLCEENNQVQCMPEVSSEPLEKCDESPEDICRAAGLMLASASECVTSGFCEEVVGSSECEETVTVWCKDERYAECGLDIPIDLDAICAEEGLIATEEAECEDDSCQTIMTVGPCGESLVIFCQEAEEIDCNAPLECVPDQVRSDELCFRGEESCETITRCEETITCRPSILCDAVPNCEYEYETPSRFVCEPGEADCYAVTECNETIFCRIPQPCITNWEPSCGEEQIYSDEPCLVTESNEECQQVFECGTAYACRIP